MVSSASRLTFNTNINKDSIWRNRSMATRALDVVTILHALDTLDTELQTTVWNPKNPAQIELFEWLGTFKEKLARITGLDAKASRFYEELNAFLAKRGFSPMID